MNVFQHHLYLRRWITCVRANHWVMRTGRLTDNATGADVSEWHALVWQAAAALALQQQRAVTVEDLRKGCHVAAFGSPKSSKVLDNGEFNRLLILWGNERPLREGGMAGLLIDPLDLASISAWRDPDEASRQSYIKYLEHTRHEAALIAICRNRWDTGDWRSRNLEELQWLGRQTRPHRAPRSPKPEYERIKLTYSHG